MGIVAQNYEVRIMSIIGLCLSDLLVVDSQRTMQWLNMIVEPYLNKLNELAQLTEVTLSNQVSFSSPRQYLSASFIPERGQAISDFDLSRPQLDLTAHVLADSKTEEQHEHGRIQFRYQWTE